MKFKPTIFQKLFLVAIAVIAANTVKAQTAPGNDLAKTGTEIRVIDNKGTIKYLQANNGITQITNSTTGTDPNTITWQLGGTLTEDTYIDATGQIFALDGLKLVNTATESASTDATDQSTSGTATGTGWTLLVRDEATGELKKLPAADLIDSGQLIDTVDATEQTAGSIVVDAVGLSGDVEQVWVYRNGSKLLQGIDFTTDVSTPGSETITVSNVTTGAGSFSLFAGDIIEVQWVK